MRKDYGDWHKLKGELNNVENQVFFHTKEIWWCSLGLNIGCEQDGKNENYERPVLVFRKFNKHVLWAIPLTSKDKIGRYYCPLVYKKHRKSNLILSQIRLVSAKRLLRRMGKMSKSDFNYLQEKFKGLI